MYIFRKSAIVPYAPLKFSTWDYLSLVNNVSLSKLGFKIVRNANKKTESNFDSAFGY